MVLLGKWVASKSVAPLIAQLISSIIKDKYNRAVNFNINFVGIAEQERCIEKDNLPCIFYVGFKNCMS